jgi:hypothetical protein
VITTNNAKIDVSLVDLFGKTVRHKTLYCLSGSQQLGIDTHKVLNAGIYILQVKNKDVTINSKVLKKIKVHFRS